MKLGDLNLDDAVYDKANPQTVSIQKSTVHPEYEPNTYANDIGIIKLKWDVEFSGEKYYFLRKKAIFAHDK